MSRTHLGVALLAAAALACVALGPASARTPVPAKYGGTLVVGLSGGDPDTLDPTVSRSNPSNAIYLAMCQTLYGHDAMQHINIFQQVATSGARNYGGYSNPRLDLILNNGLKATSVQSRSTLYHVAQQIIVNDRPIIVLYNQSTFAAFSTNLAGVQLAYNGTLMVANARYK